MTSQTLLGLIKGRLALEYNEAHVLFTRLNKRHKHAFILESKDISPIYGRLSLIGVDPCIQVSGKNESFSIKGLNDRAKTFLDRIDIDEMDFCDSLIKEQDSISGIISKQSGFIEETKRSQQKNISLVIRHMIERFHADDTDLIGLYGAFAYDFVRQFESIPEMLPYNDVPDFNLFLYDSFILFDHFKEKTELVLFREEQSYLERDIQTILSNLNDDVSLPEYKITNAKFDLEAEDYKRLVEIACEYCRQGELFEVVFSNVLRAEFYGDPLALYLTYREVNPAPYLFYFNFGNEQLVGASPEMMVRCENGRIHLRPISGTARRGGDPIEDHDNMLALLADEKERAELDMLIDLGRSDLSRICKPGIEISDYRFVEKYSQVMHTVAHLTGVLQDGYTALDGLIACLNAGTLTGAPKVAAMTAIEKHERERRGYYGGVVGYLTFSGNMDTGIIIRTAHIKNSHLRFQVGATLLYDSVPEREYQETLNKARAFLNTFALPLEENIEGEAK